MSFAQLHYPFENGEKFEKNYPGDYIVEYKGQVRAWFQRMHIMSSLIFNSRCFNNVIVTGVMAGTDGRKMSKTYKNYPDSKEIINKYGGDALRLYLMGSTLMSGENTNFDETELKNKSRNVLNPLWNSVMFFLMYAETNKWDLKNYVESENVLDKWIKIRLNQTIGEIDDYLISYNIPPVIKSIEDFVDDLSRWYVRRSRDRISSGDSEALSTLYKVLVEFSKASAPVIPFISENIYRFLRQESDETPESVHLCDFPSFEKDLTAEDTDILKNMKKARDVSSQILSIRVDKAIPVRQVLSSAAILKNDSIPEEYKTLILEETNVKNIELVDSLDEKPMWEPDLTNSIKLDIEMTDDLLKEGRAREFIRNVQDIRKEMGLQISDEIVLTYQDNSDMREVMSLYVDEIKKKLLAKEIVPGNEIKVEKL